MKSVRSLGSAGLVLALVVSLAVARQAPAAEDESDAVRAQCNAFVTAFNAHDVKGMLAVFAAESDAVNPMGARYVGKAEVEKMIAGEHGAAGPLREAKVEVKDEPLRFVSPEVAVSDASVVVTGAYGPDGAKGGPMSMVVTNVWKKTNGTWLIVACRPHVLMSAPAAATR